VSGTPLVDTYNHDACAASCFWFAICCDLLPCNRAVVWPLTQEEGTKVRGTRASVGTYPHDTMSALCALP
jgi:hypothetical protein